MPSISRASNTYPKIDISREELQSLSNNHEIAIIRRNVVVDMLRSEPQRVTEEMLAHARTELEKALRDLEPYMKPDILITEELPASYEAVATLYEESLQRSISDMRRTLIRPNVGSVLHQKATKLFDFLKSAKQQIQSMEKAIELTESKKKKAELKSELETRLARYYMISTQQFFMMVDDLLSPEHANQQDRSNLGGQPGISGTHDEILKYVTPLKQRIRSICDDLEDELKQLLDSPATQFQLKDLMPHFSPWTEEISDHALGLASVLLNVMECQPKPKSENIQPWTGQCYTKIFESALFLDDMCNKMKSLGYATQKKGKSRAQRNVAVAKDTNIQAEFAELNIDSHVDTAQESSPKLTAPSEDSNTSSGITNQKTRKLMRLLEQEPSHFFKSLHKDHRTFPPDMILQAADRAKEPTSKLIESLKRELTDPAVMQSRFADRIREKLEESKKELSLL